MSFNKCLFAKSNKKSEAPVYPVEKTWTTNHVIISLFNDAHVSADGNPLALTLMKGTDHLVKELFKMGRRVLIVNDKPITVCYFSYQHNNVTYHIKACDDNRVVLQVFDAGPEDNIKDRRLFEVTEQKTWYQFRSCRSNDLYLSHDENGFLVRKRTSDEMDSFKFDILKPDVL